MQNAIAVKYLENVMKHATLKRRFTVWALLAATALTLTGCATISESTHAYLGSPQYPPTKPEAVQVLSAEPKQPKDRLGEIILSIEGNPSRQKLEDTLRVAAAQLGADGVFIASDRTHIYPYTYWDPWWGPAAGEDWHRVVVGVAFKYK